MPDSFDPLIESLQAGPGVRVEGVTRSRGIAAINVRFGAVAATIVGPVNSVPMRPTAWGREYGAWIVSGEQGTDRIKADDYLEAAAYVGGWLHGQQFTQFELKPFHLWVPGPGVDLRADDVLAEARVRSGLVRGSDRRAIEFGGASAAVLDSHTVQITRQGVEAAIVQTCGTVGPVAAAIVGALDGLSDLWDD